MALKQVNILCVITPLKAIPLEIFGISSIEEIPALINSWHHQYKGSWTTDEVVLFKYLHQWKYFGSRCVKLGPLGAEARRIDRSNWQYDPDLLKNKDYYTDCHSLRPYNKYKAEINRLASLVGLFEQR